MCWNMFGNAVSQTKSPLERPFLIRFPWISSDLHGFLVFLGRGDLLLPAALFEDLPQPTKRDGQ